MLENVKYILKTSLRDKEEFPGDLLAVENDQRLLVHKIRTALLQKCLKALSKIACFIGLLHSKHRIHVALFRNDTNKKTNQVVSLFSYHVLSFVPGFFVINRE